MKCKTISNKFNTFVVQKLKKLKLSGQTSSKMPSMPKEKASSAVTVIDSNKKYCCNSAAISNNQMMTTTTAAPATTTLPSAATRTKEPSTLNSCGGIDVTDSSISRPSIVANGIDTTTTTTTHASKLNNISNGVGGGGNSPPLPFTKSPPSPPSTSKDSASTISQRKSHDFRFGKSIGEGSFSTVYLAQDIHTNKEYAIKVCEKYHIIKENKQENIKTEREVMNILGNTPGFVSLFCTFQDRRSLYFAMTYAKNGDLLPYINKVGSFDLECTKFYAAELVLALEEMHSRGVIHRDLKPENILLDNDMHILIADFGSAKIINREKGAAEERTPNIAKENDKSYRERKASFVGTAQYVSPELLKGEPTTRSSDLWALGCIIYQMISGLPPFRSNVEYQIFQKIQKLDLVFPDGFDETAKDLVQQLLVIDPKCRIGASDIGDRYYSLRSHSFFTNSKWETLRSQTPPQIYPYLPGEDLRSQYRIPDHLEPGLDDKQLQRLLGLELGTSNTEEKEVISYKKSIADLSMAEKEKLLRLQSEDKYDRFVKSGEVILKQGLVNKRKGLFARKRMLLLTTGPQLIYVDPVSMVKKGEIPWSTELRVEPKNFKIFFIHTPNRTYYLEEPEGYALNWCRDIEDVRLFTYDQQDT